MSTSHSRSGDTDFYQVMSSYSSTNDQTEVAIASSLVKGSITDSIENSWTSSELSGDYVDTSAISNYPPGIVTKNSVISLQHVDPSELKSYSATVAGEIKKLEMLSTSAPIYDANVVVELSQDTTFYDTYVAGDTGASVKAEFDSTDPNFNPQVAVNTYHNTVVGTFDQLNDRGTSPTGYGEATNYNRYSAYGMRGFYPDGEASSYTSDYSSKYVSNIESANRSYLGRPKFSTVGNDYQPLQNNIIVTPRTVLTSFNEDTDVGILRVQRKDAKVDTIVQLGTSEPGDITDFILNKMPLMDINATTLNYDTLKTDLKIPGTMDINQFNTLFTEDVKNTVADQYKFKIDITSSDVDAGAGYYVDENDLISQIDNSNILDNPYYMVNYVSGIHSISLSESGIYISGTTNWYQANIDSVSIDLSYGEKLSSTYAGVNGQFKLDTNTSTTRTVVLSLSNMNGVVSSDVSVYYGENGINSDMEINPYLVPMYEKVALNSANESADNKFKSDNNAFLTLYTNQVIHNEVSHDNVTFGFNNTLFTDDSIRLWNISSENILVSGPDTLFATYNTNTHQLENPVKGINIDAVMQNLVNNLTTYDTYRGVLTAKTLDQIGLDAVIQGATNWSIDYSDSSDTYLHSSATNAFDNVCTLPLYSQELIVDINNGTPLHYKYEYKTNGSATNFGDLQDYVEVTYSANEDFSNATTFKLSQRDITRTYNDTVATDIVPVSSSSYTLSGRYSKDKWQLVQVTKTTSFNVVFDPKYGPFTNIKVSISNILQTDTYYALQSTSDSNAFAPHTALQYVSTSIANLHTIFESLSMDTSVIEGVFTSADLKAFYGEIIGKRVGPNEFESISNTIDFDTYYGLDNILELTIEDHSALNPDVIIKCEYSPFKHMTNESILVNLTQLNYYMVFEYNSKNTSYSLTSFTTSPTNIPTTTNLSGETNNGYFTVTDNYACTNSISWVSTGYVLSVDIEDYIITFTVKDSNGNTVFTISKPSTQIYLGNSIVTYIPKDVWRSGLTIGASDVSNDYTENFYSTTYADSSMSFTNIPGVEVTKDLSSYAAGCSMTFRILGDFLSINLVGSISNPTTDNELGTTYNNGSLEFQYIQNENENEYSANLTFDKYRGYVGENMQTYTINRDSTSVSFSVSNDRNTISQRLTENMYPGQSLTVNNLTDDGNTVANLGISFSTSYSIPPTGSTLNYDVTVVGDNVVVTIDNPNYAGDATNIEVPSDATPVNNPKYYYAETDLKTVGRDSMYTFSGNSYINEALVAIRPSRVKLYNSDFEYDSISYYINVKFSDIKFYKYIPAAGQELWFGNPVSIGNNDYDEDPDSSLWGLYATLSTSREQLGGASFGRVNIAQNPNKTAKGGVSYVVSAPPCLKFTTMSSQNLPTPYSYADAGSNLYTTYVPYSSNTTVYSPFAARTYTGVDTATATIVKNTYVNNIAFTPLNTPRAALALATDPDTTFHTIKVHAARMKVTLYTGLYNSTSNNHVVYNGLLKDIPTTFHVLNSHIVLRNREDSGAVNFSLAQFPSDIGYSNNLESYQTIHRTTDHSNYYNLNFKIGDPAYQKSDVTLYFNCQADGVRPTLYTVVDLNNPLTKLNYRRVYKYQSSTSINFEDETTIQTLSLPFNSRKYYDTVVPHPATFSANSTTSTSIWNYNVLLEQTNIVDTESISWTTDSDFSDNVFVSWAFGNPNTSVKMTNELFYVKNNEKKWVYITLLPFQSFLNQYGLTVSELSWDGSMYTPRVSTQVVYFVPELSAPSISGVNYQIEQYSVAMQNELPTPNP